MEQLCISILIDGNPDVSAADARAIVKQLLTGVLEAQNVLGLAPSLSHKRAPLPSQEMVLSVTRRLVGSLTVSWALPCPQRAIIHH